MHSATFMTGMTMPGHVDHTDRGRRSLLQGLKTFSPYLFSAGQVVGGQAVMEGVMMRNGAMCTVAVRQPNGTIVIDQRPWFSLTDNVLFRQPFLRGFPTLIETLVNGIRALNHSAAVSTDEEDEKLSSWHLAGILCVSLALATGLFVVAPHLLSILMSWIGAGGDVEGISFHLWDGLFKFAIFIGYILLISLVPDIRRVFRYHGAEHKVIHAFETGKEVTLDRAEKCSRLHPRCGTTFLLFVLSIAILLHTLLVPLFLVLWSGESGWEKHVAVLMFKLLLMIPISAIAYEVIRYAARLGDSFWGRVLRGPGMFLQLLTTWEPGRKELEVALAALAAALGPEGASCLKMPSEAFQCCDANRVPQR